MATAIPYLDEVWNVTTGCGDDMVSPGCLNCYARRMFGRNLWKCPRCKGHGDIPTAPVISFAWPRREPERWGACPTCHGTGHQDFAPTFHADRLEQPLHWRKPRVVGVSFMGDLFHEAITDTQLDEVFRVIAACQHHTFLTLTKRPDRQAAYLQGEVKRPGSWMGQYGPLPNLWPGVTVCNQAEADRLVPILLDTPAAKRWVSLEPMLGPVDMLTIASDRDQHHYTNALEGYRIDGDMVEVPKLDWVVLGGETGPGARRMHAGWAVDVWKQCRAAGVPFYWKQAGSAWLPGDGTDDDDDSAVLDCRELPEVTP